MFVVTLVGMPGSGKSAISERMSSIDGVNWIQSRQIIRELTNATSTADMQNKGLQFNTPNNNEKFFDCLDRKFQTGALNIFDAVRPESHWDEFKRRYDSNAVLVCIDAPRDLRQTRLLEREGCPDELLLRDDHKVEAEVPTLMKKADIFVNNTENIALAVTRLLRKLAHRFENAEETKVLLDQVFVEFRKSF